MRRLVVTALVSLALTGCGGGDPAKVADPFRATTTEDAVVAAETGPRQPPPRVDASPGEVQVEEGPFTDRVELNGLSFTASDVPVVRGRLRNTVDVSEIVVLELQVDLYDREGLFLSSARGVFNDAHAGAGQKFLRFAISPRTPEPTAASAVLSIPQLVNE